MCRACAAPLIGALALAVSQTASSANAIFERDIQPILDANCVSCHQTGATSQGLNLEAGKAYGSLVSRKSSEADAMLVAPGSPDTSYLLAKILGTQGQAGGKGARMPIGGSLDNRGRERRGARRGPDDRFPTL